MTQVKFNNVRCQTVARFLFFPLSILTRLHTNLCARTHMLSGCSSLCGFSLSDKFQTGWTKIQVRGRQTTWLITSGILQSVRISLFFLLLSVYMIHARFLTKPKRCSHYTTLQGKFRSQKWTFDACEPVLDVNSTALYKYIVNSGPQLVYLTAIKIPLSYETPTPRILDFNSLDRWPNPSLSTFPIKGREVCLQ